MNENYLMKKARVDVEACINVWKIIFEKYFLDKIEYVYVKGSATKKWETPIDYVPTLSDVDIHYKLKKDKTLFTSNNKFNEAIKINEKYEEFYINSNPNYLHIPRPQLLELNSQLLNPDFVITPKILKEDCIVGEADFSENKTAEEIRIIDLKYLLNLKELLNNLPNSIMDRSGIDYINIIRRLSYEVSPTPVRLLSQLETDPYEVWNLNRTRILERLRKHGHEDLAKSYKGYYLTGWQVFQSDFKDTSLMRSLLINGYEVLSKSLIFAEKIF
ncbi:hypothetical protein JW865_07155 [Candidatus Bathyarchaeota archaeon]|nr:hypothetical protein [Candidatus Bathyarchaeota archaeon]